MKKIFIGLLIYVVGNSILPDTIELKSGIVYTGVVAHVEANSIIITKENGKKEEFSKAEVKKLVIENVNWQDEDINDNPQNSSAGSNNKNANEKTVVNTEKTNLNEIKNDSQSNFPENGKSFFLQLSLADWQVGGIQNLIGLRSSQLLNSLFFKGTNASWINHFIFPLSENKVRAKANVIDLGFKFLQKTNYPGKIQLRYLESGPVSRNSVNYWDYSDSILNFQTLEIDLYKQNTNRRSLLSYEHKLFFNPASNRLYYSRFGLQIGLNAQSDSIRGEVTALGSGSGINSLGVFTSRSSIPVPAKTTYSENSYFVNSGISCHFTPFKNQELEVSANLFKGISSGNISYNLISVYPIANGNNKVFNSELTGLGLSFGYVIKLSASLNLKLFVENRSLNYEIKKVTTTNFGIKFGDDLGPISGYKDSVNNIGFGMEYKF